MDYLHPLPSILCMALLFVNIFIIGIQSTLIPFNNGGFEDDQLAANTWTYGADIIVTSTGWTSYDPDSVMPSWAVQSINPISGTTFVGGAGAKEGNMNANLANDPCSVNCKAFGIETRTTVLTTTVVADYTYTLKVWVGNPAANTWSSGAWYDSSGFPGYRIELLAGNDVIAHDDNTLSPADGYWDESTVTFNAPSSNPCACVTGSCNCIGQILKIRLLTLNDAINHGSGSAVPFHEVYFDDVRLEYFTPSPTKSPSTSPTTSPTASPSSSPSISPSDSPSLSPSKSPSLSPSQSPTTSPTNSPTTSPTKSPTLSPTSSPSESPTVSPSNSPTNSPTQSPSTSPSDSPTTSPTKFPTISPTSSPSISPSISPSKYPSISPSLSPSTSPTTRYPTTSPTNPLKSVSLTTSNLVQDGASAIDLSASTMDTSNNDWNCHADDEIGFFLEISLDSSWGFHPTKVSNIQFTVHGTNNYMINPSLLVSFSVGSGGSASYLATMVKPMNNYYNRISPSCDTSLDPSGSPLIIGDVEANVAQNNGDGRKEKIGSWAWPQFEKHQVNAGFPNEFPLIYTLTNDPINNHLFVRLDNPTWRQSLWYQQCGFEAFGTNQGLQIFVSPKNINEDMTFTQFDITYWFESDAPTTSPTRNPSISPTISPTKFPSTSPTKNPSKSPTTSPSNSPSILPTASPTKHPSIPPTNSPSQSPSISPTKNPTQSPTISPSDSPTNSPTASPTQSPTESPTFAPTLSPSLSPSNHPTISPTDSPTNGPTQSPTDNPTNSPSTSPTKSPSTSPTANPTKSPNNSPSISPTLSPTKSPSLSPSISPTLSPSKSPTFSPTMSPSLSPTNGPTISPTQYPSKAPTLSPTNNPTSSPTNAPSDNPSFSPSSEPTKFPSRFPSLSPTAQPTKLPTDFPTNEPTLSPLTTKNESIIDPIDDLIDLNGGSLNGLVGSTKSNAQSRQERSKRMNGSNHVLFCSVALCLFIALQLFVAYCIQRVGKMEFVRSRNAMTIDILIAISFCLCAYIINGIMLIAFYSPNTSQNELFSDFITFFVLLPSIIHFWVFMIALFSWLKIFYGSSLSKTQKDVEKLKKMFISFCFVSTFLAFCSCVSIASVNDDTLTNKMCDIYGIIMSVFVILIAIITKIVSNKLMKNYKMRAKKANANFNQAFIQKMKISANIIFVSFIIYAVVTFVSIIYQNEYTKNDFLYDFVIDVADISCIIAVFYLHKSKNAMIKRRESMQKYVRNRDKRTVGSNQKQSNNFTAEGVIAFNNYNQDEEEYSLRNPENITDNRVYSESVSDDDDDGSEYEPKEDLDFDIRQYVYDQLKRQYSFV